MANPNGNAALFFDLGGTLVKLNDTREIPLDANGNIVIELLPGVAEKLRPMHNHLMFVVTNQAGITPRTPEGGKSGSRPSASGQSAR